MEVYDGKFQFENDDVFYDFGEDEYQNTGRENDIPSLGSPCLLKEKRDASFEALEERLIDYGIDEFNQTLLDLTNVERPNEFETCTVLAFNTITSQNLHLKIEINYCGYHWKGFGFGFNLENEDIDGFCFTLIDIIEDHVDIKYGAPIFCGDMGYIGRVPSQTVIIIILEIYRRSSTVELRFKVLRRYLSRSQ